jgi:hypothetical protein
MMIELPKYQETWCSAAYLPPLPLDAMLMSRLPILALASFYCLARAALMLGRTQKVISKMLTDPYFNIVTAELLGKE